MRCDGRGWGCLERGAVPLIPRMAVQGDQQRRGSQGGERYSLVDDRISGSMLGPVGHGGGRQ